MYRIHSIGCVRPTHIFLTENQFFGFTHYGICGFMGHGPLTISITVYIYEGIKLDVLHPKSLPLRR